MTSDIVQFKGNPGSLPRLPAWLTSLSGDHPDAGPTLPPYLPPASEIRSALGRCEAILGGEVSPAFARQCLAKMVVAFEPNTKLSADDMRLRLTVWMEACGDLNDALWAEATTEALKALKWMPKPSEFREIVEPRRTEARKGRERLQAMLAALDKTGGPFKAEPREVRVRSMRDSFKRLGMVGKAAKYEHELADIEKRSPEDWAKGDYSEAKEAKPERPPFVPEKTPTALRCAELARQSRMLPIDDEAAE